MLENRPLLKFDFTYWEGVSALFGTSRLDYLILFWNESITILWCYIIAWDSRCWKLLLKVNQYLIKKNPVCLYPFSCGIPEPRSFFQKVWIVQQELQTEVISWLDLAEVTLKQKIKTRPNFNVKAFSGDDNIDVWNRII